MFGVDEIVCSYSSPIQLTPASTIELAIPAPPVVKLDDKHYKLVDKMEALTTAAPSLAQATKLTVKGPVIFGPGTVIKGEVTVVNGPLGTTRVTLLLHTHKHTESPAPVDLPSATYENTTVTL